jgi:hypothetical protein
VAKFSAFLFIILTWLAGCGQGAPTPLPDGGTPPDNTVTCACDVRMPAGFTGASGCQLAGGTIVGDECWVSRAQDICFTGPDPQAFCVEQQATVQSLLFATLRACQIGYVCPGFCTHTVVSCTATRTAVTPECSHACLPVPLTLDSHLNVTNADTATFVPRELSCTGRDTDLLCRR